MATGISAPTTQSSCWRTANRAKVRPCAPGATYFWVIASKLGWAIAAAQTEPAREQDLDHQDRMQRGQSGAHAGAKKSDR